MKHIRDGVKLVRGGVKHMGDVLCSFSDALPYFKKDLRILLSLGILETTHDNTEDDSTKVSWGLVVGLKARNSWSVVALLLVI